MLIAWVAIVNFKLVSKGQIGDMRVDGLVVMEGEGSWGLNTMKNIPSDQPARAYRWPVDCIWHSFCFGMNSSISWLHSQLVCHHLCSTSRYDWWCHQYFQRRGIPVAAYIPFFGNILQWRHVRLNCQFKRVTETFPKAYSGVIHDTEHMISFEKERLSKKNHDFWLVVFWSHSAWQIYG